MGQWHPPLHGVGGLRATPAMQQVLRASASLLGLPAFLGSSPDLPSMPGPDHFLTTPGCVPPPHGCSCRALHRFVSINNGDSSVRDESLHGQTASWRGAHFSPGVGEELAHLPRLLGAWQGQCPGSTSDASLTGLREPRSPLPRQSQPQELGARSLLAFFLVTYPGV